MDISWRSRLPVISATCGMILATALCALGVENFVTITLIAIAAIGSTYIFLFGGNGNTKIAGMGIFVLFLALVDYVMREVATNSVMWLILFNIIIAFISFIFIAVAFYCYTHDRQISADLGFLRADFSALFL